MYTYDELSDEVKNHLREERRKYLAKVGFDFEQESWESVNKIAKVLNCTYEKYSDNGVNYNIYFKYNGDIGDITGYKLKTCLHNATRNYKSIYYLDKIILDVMRTYNYENGNLCDFIDLVSTRLSEYISKDFSYQFSDKGIDEHYKELGDYFGRSYYKDGELYL